MINCFCFVFNFSCLTEDVWCIAVPIFAFGLLAISFGFVVMWHMGCYNNVFCYAICNQTSENTNSIPEDRRPTLIVTQPSYPDAIIEEELDDVFISKEKQGKIN